MSSIKSTVELCHGILISNSEYLNEVVETVKRTNLILLVRTYLLPKLVVLEALTSRLSIQPEVAAITNFNQLY